MSKQVSQPPFQVMIPGGPMANGIKDLESAGGSNAFDIRVPEMYNQNYDYNLDSSNLLGNSLIQGILEDDNSGHFDETTNKNPPSTSKNLEKIWGSGDKPLGSSNHSSSSDFSSAFTPFSNNEGLGFLRRSSSITDDVIVNTTMGSNNVFTSTNSDVGSNSNISVDNNAMRNSKIVNNSAISSSNSNIIGKNNNNPVFISQQADTNQPVPNTSENLTSKLSSGVESPANLVTEKNENSNTTNNNLGFLETSQLMNERINSNEGWGKKPIRQDTPWVLEGSMYANRRDESEPLSQATPQPDMQGLFWDNNSRITNCSESDRNFGVWTEPGRNNNMGMAGASGVGIWKTNLNMGVKPDLPPATPQPPQLPPHLFQQQHQQSWNANDHRFLWAAVAQKLSEEDQNKNKWSSSNASSNSNPWEDKNPLTNLVNNLSNNPWNSSQRMDGLQPDINQNVLQHLLSLGPSLENAQKYAQSTDLMGKNKQYGGFDGSRGRPLFAQKAHNTAQSPLPHSFNQPRLDFNQPSSILHNNIFSPGSNANMPGAFNGMNLQQENALKTLVALQQQHQQQMPQNNADLLMMMMNDQKAAGDASKESMLSQLMGSMRVDNRWVPGNDNNNNQWNLPHQEEPAFLNNNVNNQMGAHMLNNVRLSGWQGNKMTHPNTANIAYNWLYIRNFSGDLASLQFIGSQNRALKYFGGSHSNSLLILFPSTEDTMKVKGHLVMNNMQCELLDNATANKELQTGAWSLLPPAPSLHHHQNFLARQMYNSVRY